MSERAPYRTEPGRERTARHKQASQARWEAGASARGTKDPHTNEQASTESKGEHASKRENSRRERGRKRRRGGERVRKSRRAIRHHRDRIALHARSHCRTERVTKRPNAPHGPEPLSDNTSKRAPRRTYVRARRESRSKAEGRKREGKRVTPLGAANPSASSSTQLARLTLARSTAIPSLFLIRAHSPFFFSRDLSNQLNTAQRNLPSDVGKAQQCRDNVKPCTSKVMGVMLLKHSVELYSRLVEELSKAIDKTAEDNYVMALQLVQNARVNVLEPAVRTILDAIHQTKTVLPHVGESEESQELERAFAEAAMLGNASFKLKHANEKNVVNHPTDMPISRQSLVTAFYFMDDCTYLKLKSREIIVKTDNFTASVLRKLIVSSSFEFESSNYAVKDKKELLRQILAKCKGEVEETRRRIIESNALVKKAIETGRLSSDNSYATVRTHWKNSCNASVQLNVETDQLLAQEPPPTESEFTLKALQLFENSQQVVKQYKALKQEVDQILPLVSSGGS